VAGAMITIVPEWIDFGTTVCPVVVSFVNVWRCQDGDGGALVFLEWDVSRRWP
jgi:hypothetical protein